MKKLFAIILAISSLALLLLTGCVREVPYTYLAEEGGFIVGETRQSIPEGEVGVEVEAIAGGGYYFIGWSDGKTEPKRIDVASSDASPEGVTVTAKFAKLLNVEYRAEEGGFLVGEVRQSLTEGGTGTEVEAIAKEGYYFTGWSDGKTENKRSDTLSVGAVYTAKFQKLISVSYQAEDGGFIVGQAEQSLQKGGTSSEVEAVAKEGYYFTGWSDGKTDSKRSDTLNAENSEEKLTYSAKFEKYTTVEYMAEEGGLISGAAQQSLQKGGTGSEVEAVAKEGYYFTGWSDGKTEAKRSDTLNAENSEEKLTYSAKFEKYITVEYTAEEGGLISGVAQQSLQKGGTSSEVEAVAKEGYYFTGWSDGKTDSKRSDTLNAENSEEKLTYSAKFEKYITLKYEAGEGGTISGEATQNVKKGGTGSEVEAVAKEGYRFVDWSDQRQDAKRADAAPAENTTLTARFVRVYQVTFLLDNALGGSLEGTTTQCVSAEESTSVVKAIPHIGYAFSRWSNGSNEAELSIRTDRDIVLIAYFEIEALGLPIIEIDTENEAPVLDKETYVPCVVSIGNTDYAYQLDNEGARIKCRGNTTMGFDKKPYKVKFTNKQNLFGFGKAKTWVLLADYFDGSMLRNRLALSCGLLIGAEVTSHTQPVEVYMNGRYVGVYLLCEQTEAGSTRVDIVEDVSSVGGDDQAFLVEMDNRAPQEGVEGLDWFYHYDDVGSKFFTVKSPETDSVGYNESVTENIRRIVQETWNIVATGTWEQIKNRIDVDSFAQTCLIHQLFKTYDALAFSWYLYKDAGADSKIVSGPIWDFDLSAGLGDDSHGGNPQVVKAEDLWPNGTRSNRWYVQLLKHVEFQNKMKSLLEQYNIENEIMSKAQEAKDNAASYYRNYERWDNLHLNIAMNPAAIRDIPTWEGHVDFLVDYLKRSLNYLKTYYNELTGGTGTT